jgi:phytoene desaturase
VVGNSIIIIGAGLAGLSAGCYAQMNGYRSQVFEHHTTPGGVAACWKRKGYLIDGGIHFLMGHKPGSSAHELYRQLGAAQANRFLGLTTYGRFIDEASGRSVVVTQELGRLADDLKTLSPADARAIDDHLKEMWEMRRMLRYLIGRYSKTVADYVQDLHNPWLREFLRYLFLPEVPVWFISMLLALIADGQIGLLEGGCLGFVLPIEKRYRDLGGRVSYKATVEEILVESDQAVGVRLAGGSEHRADVVVSAADGYSTVFEMLGGRYLDRKIENRYNSWKLVRPMIMVNYGVAREFPDEPTFTTIMLERPFAIDRQPISGIFVRIFNYSPKFAPLSKTVVQVEFETDWDYWNNLESQDRARYDAEKERVAAEVLERLEAHYPGISSQVEMTDVATPYTTWRYTLNHKGASMGWLPTPEVINTRLERTLPGLANFYMAGQWVTPGGGVLPCLYSGRHVAQILCHRDGKPFTATIP